MATLTIATVYIPHAERAHRDESHRPERFTEDMGSIVDRWQIIPDMSPVADYWRAATIPYVTIIAWRGTGTFTVKRSANGVGASTGASTWDEAVRAAYAYASWDNSHYAR